jgi:uncharacterized membrane protein YphA (DoxX/SURF4 family)
VLFEVSAVLGVILLSSAVVLVMAGAVIEASRVQNRPQIRGALPLHVTVVASIVTLVVSGRGRCALDRLESRNSSGTAMLERR